MHYIFGCSIYDLIEDVTLKRFNKMQKPQDSFGVPPNLQGCTAN